MTLRDFVKNSLFYCSEIMLDAATPGQVAKERLVRNAGLLKESSECLAASCNESVEQLWKEIWSHEPEAYRRHKERERKDGKGRKAR